MSQDIIKINKLELASELAHNELERDWSESVTLWKDEEAEVLEYTEEAQEIFNELYDKYLNFLEEIKEK